MEKNLPNSLKFLFFLAFFWSISLQKALGQPLLFNHLMSENGLTTNSVVAIAQDENGFLWFGTPRGLNRFDGMKNKIFSKTNPVYDNLYSNYINALLRDSKNRLWIGTNTGLNFYDEENDKFLRVKINAEDRSTIKKIFEDSKGIIWLGTTNGLFALRNDDTSTVVRFKNVNGDNLSDNITGICEDHRGNIWVGSATKLTRLWAKNSKYQYEEYFHDPKNDKSLSSNSISDIHEDENNKLWIGTSKSGINLYDHTSNSFKRFNRENTGLVHDNVRSFLSRNKNELWIGTQEGLSILNTDNYTVTSYQHNTDNPKSISHNSIYSLFRDNNKSVWIGTFFGGVNRVDSIVTKFYFIQNDNRNSLPNVVSCIAEDSDNSLWMTTEGGGLVHYWPEMQTFKTYRHNSDDPTSIASNQTKVIYIDKDKQIWCGTNNGGLNLFDRQTETFKRIPLPGETAPPSIFTITEDRQNRFWVSTNNGIRIFERTGTTLREITIQVKSRSFGGFLTTSILHDAKDNIWLASVDGLFRYRNNRIDTLVRPETAHSVIEATDGSIWVGFQDKGLGRYNETSNKIDYIEAVNDAVKDVFAILEDDAGHFWLSSSNGMHRYNPADGTVISYNAIDGVLNKEFMYNSRLKSHSGEFFFGGVNGIIRFFPKEIPINTYKAPLVFTGLQLKNKEVSLHTKDELLKKDISKTQKLVFKYNQDIFSINFAMLNFIKSDKNKYAYKLSGFDEDWKQTTSGNITYSNLKDGRYKLYVKGANNDGIWTDPITMEIQVLPPVWKSWWAYLIYLLFISALVFLVTRFIFLRAVLKKEGQLQQLKLNFFSNISHEVRTHLSLIANPVEKLMGSAHLNTADTEQVTRIQRNTDRLLNLVNELLDFRKVDSNKQALTVAKQNIVPFLKEIFSNFEDMASAKNIDTSFVGTATKVPVYFDEKQMEKVFFNLLSNALKFTPQGGNITLSVETKAKFTEILVSDTGIGIPEKYLPNLFTNYYQVADYGDQNTGYGLGLALSRKIAELHHGSIEVESRAATDKENGFTQFRVILLNGDKHFLHDKNVTIIEKTSSITESAILPTKTPIEQLDNINTQGPSTNSVLVVEDNPELRELLVQSLSEIYEVHEAVDGQAGYETARETIPDLIISDVMMPQMDGYQLTESIKSDDRTNHIPLILLTAKTTHEDQWEGLQKGADLYLSKPFSVSLLLLNVRNLLSTQKLQQQKILREVVALNVGTTNKNGSPAVEEDSFFHTVLEIIDKKLDDADFGVERLSRDVGMSQPVLYKKIRALTNLSVNELIKVRRFRKAAELLLEGQLKINEIAYTVGFDDRKYFSKEFKKYYGVTPSEFTEASSAGSTNVDLDALLKQQD